MSTKSNFLTLFEKVEFQRISEKKNVENYLMYVKFLNISDDDDHVQAEKIKTLKLCYESNLHEFIMALDDFSQASELLSVRLL